MADSDDLRRRAEARFRRSGAVGASGLDASAAAGSEPDSGGIVDSSVDSINDPVALLEDLRIHKAELEIQNQELREARDRAEAEQDRYRQLFEQLPMPAMVIDRIGVIRDANPAAAEYFGFRSVAGLQSHSMFRLIADGGERLSLRLSAGEAVGGTQTLNSVYLKAGDRGAVLADLSLIALHDGYHMDRRELLVVRDRQDEQAREEDRRLYETLLDNANSLIYAFGVDDRCLLWNARMARRFNCPSSDAVGQLRGELLPPLEAEQGRALDRKVIEERHARTDQARLPSDDERGAQHLVTRFPLYDRDGRVFGVGVIAGDISELLRVRSRLDVALQVFNNGAEGVAILDNKARITFCNRAFQRMLDLDERAILGRSPVQFLDVREGDRALDVINEALHKRDRWQGERWVRRQGGEVFPSWLRVSVVRDPDHAISNYIVIADDITKQKSAEEEIERLAYYDGLTGTPNRHLLRDRVRQEIRASHRSGEEFALLFLDLDQFKDVNDAFGHGFGDRLLIEFSRRVTKLVRELDTVCRIGGDEFVVLMPRIHREEVVKRVDAILAEAVRPFEIEGEELRLSASLGIAMYPGDATDFEGLLKHADSAMYEAKRAGRNTYRFFDVRIAEEVESQARLQQALRRALEEGQLSMVYQPQVALADRSLVGVEALIRWNDAEFGGVPPDVFIPLAESGGMIQRLGARVLDAVFAQMQDWQGTVFEPVQVSINIAPEQFWSRGFEQQLLERLETSGVRPEKILLEITERTAMKDPGLLIERMKALKARGIELSIDDFGTGYSSLAYLQRFPLRQLKIDKRFVQRIGDELAGEQICRSVLQLAHTLGMEVVAEGVETERQAEFLRDAGCEIGQGYLFARPMVPEALIDWWAGFRRSD